MSDIGKSIAKSLRKFASDLKRGNVKDYRLTRVIRLANGSVKVIRAGRGK